MNNHPEIIKKEYSAEDIRTTPYNGIIEKPFPLRQIDYDNLTHRGVFPSLFWVVLTLLLGQLLLIVKNLLETNFDSIKNSDIIILIILSLVLLGIYFIGFKSDKQKEKRYIKELIRKHFEENRAGIEEQRKLYGKK